MLIPVSTMPSTSFVRSVSSQIRLHESTWHHVFERRRYQCRSFARLREQRRLRWQRKKQITDIPKSVTTGQLDSDDDSDDEDAEDISMKRRKPSDPLDVILLGRPLKDHYFQIKLNVRFPKTYDEWKDRLSLVWDQYKWSFEGFILEDTGRPLPGTEEAKRWEEAKLKPPQKDDVMKDSEAAIQEQIDGMKKNVSSNVDFLRDEGGKMLELAKEYTGIRDQGDMRTFAAGLMKLATLCVSEFMSGYRKGRDDEVEKVINHYFQQGKEALSQAWEKLNEPDKKRRRMKRRQRTPE